MASPITDTHVHLDRFDDTEAVVDRARVQGVTMFHVTFLPSDYLARRDRFADQADIVVGLGFHPMASRGFFPWQPHIDLDAEIELVPTLAADATWIGEIGLDHTPDGAPFRERQEQMLSAVLGSPTVPDKFMTVHTRDAEREAVDRLAAAGVTRAAIHGNGFTGDVERLQYVLDAGYSFSIVPSMFHDDHGRALVAALPPERTLLETDGPFGIVDARALEPRDVTTGLAPLADAWGTDEDGVRRQLADNLARLITW